MERDHSGRTVVLSYYIDLVVSFNVCEDCTDNQEKDSRLAADFFPVYIVCDCVVCSNFPRGCSCL